MSRKKPAMDRDVTAEWAEGIRGMRFRKPEPAFGDWRDIDSAPKDGTRVLTHRQGFAESMAVAWWHESELEWVAVHGSYWPEPTHWMPLPPAPKSKGRE